jgi:hypothetical protein
VRCEKGGEADALRDPNRLRLKGLSKLDPIFINVLGYLQRRMCYEG